MVVTNNTVRDMFRDDLTNRRLWNERGRGALGLAVRVVDWLPGGVTLLTGDGEIAVVAQGQFVGVLERHGKQWGWQQ